MPLPIRVLLSAGAALALSGLGIHGLRLWAAGGRDGERDQDAETAARRGFSGLILGTACFMVAASSAVLGLWGVVDGG